MITKQIAWHRAPYQNSQEDLVPQKESVSQEDPALDSKHEVLSAFEAGALLQDKQNPRILIIGPAWIGDMVMAQTLFKLLRRQYPQAEIEVAAPASAIAPLKYMPEVNQIHELPFRHGQLGLWRRLRMGLRWRARQYDWSIVLPNSWKSALLPWAANISRRTGWVGEQRYGLLNDIRSLDKNKYPLMIERFMALGVDKRQVLSKPYPWPRLQIDDESGKQCLARHGVVSGRPLLVLCPGAAYGPSKRWPAEYFAEVASTQLKQKWQVVLLGSPNEKDLGQTVVQHAPGCIDLIGDTSLDEAINMLSQANAVVCNDSGLMHVVSALGQQAIAVYGSTSTDFTPPLSDRVERLQTNLSCQPCFKKVCPLQHHKCMRDIRPQQVIQALQVMKS